MVYITVNWIYLDFRLHAEDLLGALKNFMGIFFNISCHFTDTKINELLNQKALIAVLI